jgi:CRISPR-associated endoribonuclease Cas6
MDFTSNSLHSIIVNLSTENNSKVPLGLNRAIHAQVLAWLQRGKPEISALVHKTQRSPLSISELINKNDSPITKSKQCKETNRCFFKVNFLQAYLVPILLKGVEADNRISLANHQFNINGVDCFPAENSLAQLTSYQELFEHSEPSREIKLSLLSPTSFKQNGCIQPFPLPELVFSNLLRRWNSFAPKEYHFPKVEWQGMTAAYDLKTKVIKKEVNEIGSVGWVKYEFKDEKQAKIATILANFANFSGIGRKTALGMGRTQFKSKI